MIVDECGVIGHIKKLAQNDSSCEHCAVAIAENKVSEKGCQYSVVDYCMIEDIGGKTNTGSTTIPKAVTCALINTCKNTKKIPVIIHTHIFGYEHSDPLSFSPQDMSFIKKFSQYVSEIGNIPVCIFIVTNGDKVLYCYSDIGNMKYYFKEEG